MNRGGLLVVAGEASGDLHGARMLRQRADVDWEVTVVVGRDWRERP